MRTIFEEMLRPLSAMISSAELIGAEMDATQRFDGMVSRFVHNLIRLHGDAASRCASCGDASTHASASQTNHLDPNASRYRNAGRVGYERGPLE